MPLNKENKLKFEFYIEDSLIYIVTRLDQEISRMPQKKKKKRNQFILMERIKTKLVN